MATENSAEVALPEEILTEILSRLPVKSLLKLRCVSKSWLSLISSPEFVKKHLQVSTKNNMLYSHDRLLYGSITPPTALYSRPLYPEICKNSPMETVPFDRAAVGSLKIVGSCNGLVCVVVEKRFILWNPTTRKSKQLPSSQRNHLVWALGFGYDASTDDYKVVESGRIGIYGSQVKVYSSRLNMWSIMAWIDAESFFGEGLFVSGAVHWALHNSRTKNNYAIFALNMTTEYGGIISIPNSNRENRTRLELGTTGENLCAAYVCRDYVDVWMMREYGVESSWTKLVCVPYYNVVNCGHSTLRLFFVLENGGVVLQYAPGLMMFKASEFRDIDPHTKFGQVTTYTESLISPDFENAAESGGEGTGEIVRAMLLRRLMFMSKSFDDQKEHVGQLIQLVQGGKIADMSCKEKAIMIRNMEIKLEKIKMQSREAELEVKSWLLSKKL